MTIRRQFDFDNHNRAYMHFEAAVDAAPEGLYSIGRNVKYEIGESCDDLLRTTQRLGVPICNCDGIREIEVLMFERIRANNNGTELDELVQIGLFMNNNDQSFGEAHFWTTHKALLPDLKAEQQADGTWAVMEGLAFRKGGYLSEELALAAIKRHNTFTAEAMA